MKTLYLDIFSGISGDMCLGALLDLGVSLDDLKSQLGKLRVDGYHLHAQRKQNSQIEGIKFDVHLEDEHHHSHAHHHNDEHHHHHHDHEHHDHEEHHHHHSHADEETHAHSEHHHSHSHSHSHETQRDFQQIQKLIAESGLSEWVKEKSVAVFRRIALAEGKIHGSPPERVHFHEVGAIDSIVDIVGTCIALEILGKPRVLSAPVVEGTGWVNCAHGRFPVPTTATLEILGARRIPLTQCEEPSELVTPTGAALLAEFAESFGPMQNLVATKIGYGLGTRQNRTRPNVLRAVLGEIAITATPANPNPSSTSAHDWETDSIFVLETNIDDCSAEVLGYVGDQLIAQGALDVFHTPIQMKKNRPGVLLTVLCNLGDADRFTEFLFLETTAFGVRRTQVDRRKLRREFIDLDTSCGKVSIKIGSLNGKIIQAAPEFESCKQLATLTHKPLRTIFAAAEEAVRFHLGKVKSV